MTSRPVDLLPTPPGFVMSRQAALQLSSCARCGCSVDRSTLLLHEKEYDMTALCVDCTDEIYAWMAEQEEARA